MTRTERAVVESFRRNLTGIVARLDDDALYAAYLRDGAAGVNALRDEMSDAVRAATAAAIHQIRGGRPN